MSVHILDTRQLGRAGIVAATALETGDGVALFDTGPESTFDNVVRELGRNGFSIGDVRHVFLSHIHFDHAGAAWRLAQPAGASEKGATIYVHPRGAPHLLDPTKLIQSATRIFGDDMERLWGRIAAVPADRLRILEDGDRVKVGSYEIQAVATPGHASHHHVYHWEDNLFGGDVAGVRMGKGPPIPPFVPPELHVESWLDSIAKMRALNAAHLYLPHFGEIGGSIDDHFSALEDRVRRWAEWYREQIAGGAGEQGLTARFAELEHRELRNNGSSESEVTDYEAADPSHMAVPAAVRYWQKFHPEKIGK